MLAADRLKPDLGPDFDARWRRAARPLRRELIADIRSIYRMLVEDDVPMLASMTPNKAPPANTAIASTPSPTPRPTKPTSPPVVPRQTSLFGTSDTPALPATENPFLPQSVRERLQHSQAQARTQLQPLLQTAPPVSHEQVDLERELRLRLGPIIETLIDAHIDTLKGELRVRLRAEMDRLIADHLRK